MPHEMPTWIAGGTIRVSRFCSLMTSANDTVEESDAADTKIIGISTDGQRDAPQTGQTADEAAIAGQPIKIHGPGEVALLKMDASGCTAGDFLKPDNDGKGDVAGANDVSAAIALATAAANEVVRVWVLEPAIRQV